MTPYHETFIPIFLVGCAIATTASLVAGWMRGCLWPGALLLLGALAFWISLFFGSASGYSAWQSMPDPPEEAFSDTAVAGALLFGWFPGGLVCLIFFSAVRLVRAILRGTRPKAG